MQKLSATLLAAATLASAACATKSGTGAAVGATGGGIIGGLAGGVPGLLIGAAAGGVLGYTAGRVMEEDDRRRVAAALEADRAARWTNPDNGYQYYVEPTGGSMQSGRPCREFRLTSDTDKGHDQVYGTACQRQDGTWELVSG